MHFDRPINVISFCDGKSCGRLALARAGIKVDKYYAAEIDPYAIAVASKNWPDNINLGDVKNWRDWDIDWSSIDLIIAGSPCQGFSFAGKQLAFDDPRSALYFEFERLLKHVRRFNPAVLFMLENVKMKQQHLNVITRRLAVKPVMINSQLVSAQHRVRYYWANWDITQPEDKGIYIKDIIDPGIEFDEVFITQRGRGNNPGGARGLDGKSPCLSSSCWEYNHDFVFCMNPKTNDRRTYQQDRVYDIEGKFPALTASLGGRFNIGEGTFYRRISINEMERLQTLPVDYTAGVSKTQRSKMIGNGWTVDVVTHIFEQMQKPLLCHHTHGAYITHFNRVETSEQNIRAAIEHISRSGKKLTKAEVGRQVGLTREHISRNYSHLFAA